MSNTARAGEAWDRRGYPIYPGDLCRQVHFRTRSRTYYLHHVASLRPDGYMEMVPAQYADPSTERTGGQYLLESGHHPELTILAGHGPGDCLDYDDRDKRPVPRKELPRE